MKLEYAENFNVDFYSGELSFLTISDGSRYLIVPEDGFVPADIDADIVVLKQPITDIYLAASASMSLFDALESLDNITLSGIQADSWYIENAKQAMESGGYTDLLVNTASRTMR